MKIIKLFIITILLILVTTTSFAATATIDLESNLEEVEIGETFTVILSGKSEDGINGKQPNKTTSKQILPKAGKNGIILLSLIITTGCMIKSYKKYNKYKGIK